MLGPAIPSAGSARGRGAGGEREIHLLNAVVVNHGRRRPPSTLVIGAGRFRLAERNGRAGSSRRASGHGPVCLDLEGQLVFPGLVNAHDHLHLNVFPPTRPRERYDHSADWVADMAREIETSAMRRLRDLPRPARAWHGALKNALSGATTVVHHDPWLDAFDAPGFPIAVVRGIGWAHSLGQGGAYGPTVIESLVAATPGRPWFIHLAEGTDLRARRELGLLEAAGGLGPHTRLIHAVGLDPSDRSRAVDAGAGMIWCPSSNAFLLGEVADPSDWVAAGRAALGTDARLTGSRDLLDELAFAAGTGWCAPRDLLAMVTWVGASLCGRPEAGRIATGAPADLLVLADDGRDPAEQLGGTRRSDLRLVLSRGRPVMADPDLATVFDEPAEPAWPARLDGKPKSIAASALRPLVQAGIVEPGLEVEGARDG